MPKENTSGMDGMDEISISNPPLSNHAGNAGTDWAWMGMDGTRAKPKQGLLLHWIAPSGAIETQGYLLELGVDGRGRVSNSFHQLDTKVMAKCHRARGQ